MKKRLFSVLCLVTLVALFAIAQGGDEGYQMARVVAFERVAASAQHMEKSDNYKISMRLGSTVYACRASGSVATFNDWTTGKEFPAKVNGKILLVKNADGQVLEFNIAGKKTQN